MPQNYSQPSTAASHLYLPLVDGFLVGFFSGAGHALPDAALKVFAETFERLWPQLMPELFSGLVKEAYLSARASTNVTDADSQAIDFSAALTHISRPEWIRRVIRRALGHLL